ncbi:MAG TPA: hypothetical protein VG734_14210 [Lacunisphaera sp.]|nr:hypothetical protein [Lacunisphaera sp.]
MSPPLKKALLSVGICLWFAGAAWGMKWMTDYSFKPGATGAPGQDWPAAGEPFDGGQFTVVVGLHPECPCSRATLAELDSILLAGGHAIKAVLIFSDTLPGEPAKNSELYRQGAALPRTRLVCDSTGADLKRFALETSGETRLYRSDGRLVFSGGITGSRGHVGDNPGRSALLAALQQRGKDPGPPARTPVFGCSID